MDGLGRAETDRAQARWPNDPAEAVERLMALYGSSVLRTAFFYLGDSHLAEDVSQEVFLRAYRGWGHFRGESAPRTWLVRITINLCRDHRRVRASTEAAMDTVLLDRPCPLHLEDEAMARLERSAVLRAVLSLPWPYQEVFYLHYYLDLNVREAARAAGIPEGTVRTRLFRGRAMLKERLTEGGWGRGND